MQTLAGELKQMTVASATISGKILILIKQSLAKI